MHLRDIRSRNRFALATTVLLLGMFSSGAAAQRMIRCPAEQDSTRAVEPCSSGLDPVDITPPRVEIELIGTRESQISPAGLPYFVAPVSVALVVSAQDASDPSPVVETVLDDEPYSPDMAVSALGIHTVHATAVDRDGNHQTESVTFQIRERPVYAAYTLVEEFQCVEGPRDIRRIQGTLILASDQFDTSHINLSSLGIWLLGESGEWMTDQPIRVRGGSRSAQPGLRSHRADAEFEECVWAIDFFAQFRAQSLVACPASLAVTGRGLANQPDAFDLVGFALVLPDPQGRSALIEQDWTCEDPGEDPPEDDPVPCQWKIEPSPVTPAICSGSNAGNGVFCAWGHSLFLRVDGDRFNGSSTAFASGAGLGNFCSAGLTCSRSNSMSYQVFLEGDDCCNDCTIQFMASPTFTARVSLNPNGSASAGGYLSVCPPCGCASASGSVTVHNDDDAFGSINNVPFVTPLIGGAASISPIGNMPACTVNACSATVSIAASGDLSTLAYTSLYNNYAEADASLTNASAGLQINHSTNCDDEDLIDPNLTFEKVW